MSTGMCYLEEIKQTLDILKENGAGEITLLHCTTEYPTPLKDVNLKAMLTLKEKFDCKVGYSDHTPGIEIPTAAAAMGASVIEKHFTLSRNMEGPDQKASLEPDELRTMVTAIRNIELALGNGKKEPAGSEMKNMPIARKKYYRKEKHKGRRNTGRGKYYNQTARQRYKPYGMVSCDRDESSQRFCGRRND